MKFTIKQFEIVCQVTLLNVIIFFSFTLPAQAQTNYVAPVISYVLDSDADDSQPKFDATVIPVPENGAYHGVLTREAIAGGPGEFTLEGRLLGLAEFEKRVYQTNDNSRRVAFDRQFYRWDNFVRNNDVHPYVRATSELGRIPVISINSKLADGSLLVCPDGSPSLAWACISKGEFDAHIINIAATIRDSGLPMLAFSFMHEPEDEIRCNANDDCMGTAAEYVAAWRHIVNLFRQQNVNNVDFMWITRSRIFGDSVPTGFPTPDEIYPGDDYIDWIATDAYNFAFVSGGQDQWKSLKEVASEFYKWGSQHPKPLAFGEWGTREEYFNPNNDGSRKAAWFDDARFWLKNEATQIKAVMYFNLFVEGEFNNPDMFGNTGPDWRINTTPLSLDAYRRLAQDPYFIDAGDL